MESGERAYDKMLKRLDQRHGGGVTVYAYDSRGRVQTVSRGPAENDPRERIETSYDLLTGKKSLERMLAFEAGAWVEKQRQSFAYDSHARLQTLSHADGAAIHYTYDAEDRIATVRDENHAAPNTFYAYDPAGRLATVTQTLAGASAGVITTSYAYDTDGNLTAVTDPNGNITGYVYDDFGQLTSQESPVTGTTTYAYDSAGNLTQMTDARGVTTTREYDAMNRVTTATSTVWPKSEVVSWSYDDPTAGRFAVGRLSTMTDPSGSTAYHYERRGLLRDETRSLTGAQYTYTTGFQYDADGNRAVVQYPSTQLTVQYGFDYAGRPASASNLVTTASYRPFGPMKSLSLANGTTQTFGYDARYRVTSNSLLFGQNRSRSTPTATTQRCGCDQTPQCKACNSSVLKCFSLCSLKGGIGSGKKPNYYCAKLHKYIDIPKDFPTYDAALKGMRVRSCSGLQDAAVQCTTEEAMVQEGAPLA